MSVLRNSSHRTCGKPFVVLFGFPVGLASGQISAQVLAKSSVASRARAKQTDARVTDCGALLSWLVLNYSLRAPAVGKYMCHGSGLPSQEINLAFRSPSLQIWVFAWELHLAALNRQVGLHRAPGRQGPGCLGQAVAVRGALPLTWGCYEVNTGVPRGVRTAR